MKHSAAYCQGRETLARLHELNLQAARKVDAPVGAVELTASIRPGLSELS